MAELVGGFIVPHAPMLITLSEVVNTDKKKACDAAYIQTVERLKELNVDTIVVIGDDHYTLFGPNCIPSALIGIGDIDGPEESRLGSGESTHSRSFDICALAVWNKAAGRCQNRSYIS